jgi:hypothetical protein
VADPLLQELLAKPVGPAIKPRTLSNSDFTRRLAVKGDEATVEVKVPSEVDTEDFASKFLAERGYDPCDWEPTGFRTSEWTMPNGETGVSARHTFTRRKDTGQSINLDLSELLATIDSTPRLSPDKLVSVGGGAWTLIVAIGDMQFGKTDGEGIKGTLRRTIACLDRARDRALELRKQGYLIAHIHIAWLGDHIEGFVSQGGANVWRTQLTLNEQIRLTRRVMLHALLIFSPICSRLTMAAVPGNHGETVRFAGKGITRYDDSHDTESLIAVADAAALNEDRFGHVEFFVPETDEMTVVVECSGTIVAHAHGHQWSPNKHFIWWKGQAFDKSSAMHMADLLLAGHLHHEHIEAEGPRTFIGVPSMESESTWFRHRTGTTGAPGLLLALTRNGSVPIKEVVTSE